jgi:hypothetical protein
MVPIFKEYLRLVNSVKALVTRERVVFDLFLRLSANNQ